MAQATAVIDLSERRKRRGRRWGSLEPLDPEELQATVRLECNKAVEWIESNVSIYRQISESYYQGKTRLENEPGRSSVVVTAVRDTVRSVLTSIGRVFTQTDTVGEFSSDDEEDEEICRQMTVFANGIFNKYGGFNLLMSASTDALHQRVGVGRVTLQRREIPSQRVARGVTDEQYDEIKALVQSGKEIITETTPAEPDPMTGQPTRDVVLTQKSYRYKWILECEPPETLIVDANATSTEDSRLIGIRRNLPIYEAMEMGLSYEDISPLTQDDASMFQTERINRQGFDQQDYQEWATDPTNRWVLITEIWIRIDKDGDGVTELRHMICAGINYEILVDEPATCIPLAIFKSEIQPHVFFPISLAEDMIQDQDAQTVMLRSILDNVGLVNNPRTAFDKKRVNIEDLKNNELGAMVRCDGPPGDVIQELATPFVAGETLPVLQALQDTAERRSGVTKLSQGIDPNALQSTSRIAANAAVQGGDARIEMMVRNLAETGMADLFKTIIRVAIYEMKGPVQIKQPHGGYKKIMPELWHDQINININVGMGNGRIEEKLGVLDQTIQYQTGVFQQAGPDNPFVKWNNIRNAQAMKLRLVGIKTVGDLFPSVTPEQEATFSQQQAQKAAQAAQAQSGQSGPAPDVVGAAKIKAEADVMNTQAKIQAQGQADQQKLQTESQLKIAEMQQESQLEVGKLQMQLGSQREIAEMQTDQRRDADNQRYAVAAEQAQIDAQTRRDVAKENATNQFRMAKEKARMTPRPNGR